MTFSEYVAKRELQEGVKAVDYKPGALIPTDTHRKGGPEHMNPFKAQSPSLPVKPKPYMPIFRVGKSPKQSPSTIVGK